MTKARLWLAILISGLFLLSDQWLKWQTLHHWTAERLINNFLGWKPFLNPGIGTGIPLPNWLILAVSAPILILILWLGIYYFLQKQTLNTWAMALIFAGALSNFADRIFVGATVDYFLILTGIINLADVSIVAGFVLYLCNNFRKDVSQTPSSSSDRT